MILVGESRLVNPSARHWNLLPASSVLELGTLIHNHAQHRCFIYWVCPSIPHPFGHIEFLTQAPKSHMHFPTAQSMFCISAFTENSKKKYFIEDPCHIITYYHCTFSRNNV